MNEDCIFCKIANSKTPTRLEKETQHLSVFADKNPQAPVHLLIVPKIHIEDLADINDTLWNEMKTIIVAIAKERSLAGYRIVHNSGEAAMIPHFHCHLLGEVAADRRV